MHKYECAEMVDKRFIVRLRNEGDEGGIAPNNSTTVYLIILQGIAIEIGK
jgi:arabinose-5-phosphate isomerase